MPIADQDMDIELSEDMRGTLPFYNPTGTSNG